MRKFVGCEMLVKVANTVEKTPFMILAKLNTVENLTVMNSLREFPQEFKGAVIFDPGYQGGG